MRAEHILRPMGAPPELEDQIAEVAVVRSGREPATADWVAREEPLEIRLHDVPLAVIMRTPGHDVELVTGFLVTERVVASVGDLVSVRPCPEAPSPDAAGNVMQAVLRPGVAVDLESLRRNLYASSSCGVCGKATLENALAAAPPLDDPARFDAAFFARLPSALRHAQPAFARTGGLHAAALVAPDGAVVTVREDVGRHNAVDKVVGAAVRSGRLPLTGHVLLVSGRVSFEIVQKALAARVPVIAAVSAPTSLAVELAAAARIALVGFLRGDTCNVYGATDRVRFDAAQGRD